MQCNINSRGKALRLVSGLVITLLGIVLLTLLIAGVLTGWVFWTICVLALGAGIFQIYEGWAGWCVLRAIGFKTPV
ncbi:MAG: hypothetical protein IT444_01445 [Phycisphaeraceae bacterium]|nr:hypothetical protein [Phycisphaeraceae bacterium]